MGNHKTGISSNLFEPIDLRGVMAKNRIMISPMCQYSAPDAVPNDWHLVHLGSRAIGGAGIVMTEATAVEPEGRITLFDLGLWKDEQESAFKRITAFISEQGALPGIQLGHSGRKASHRRPWEDRKPLRPEEEGWEVIGPSPIPWEEGDLIPREMTSGDIEQVIFKFKEAAKRALRAGFRVIEVHAAHGYLLHSFLSPLSNHRSDGYGGDFDGRIRMLLETIEAIRCVWPGDLPLFVRVSATDWLEGGWQVPDTVKLAKRLKALGVDLIDCSSGGNGPGIEFPLEQGYQVSFAEIVRRESDMKTATVGLIRDPHFAQEIISQGRADIVVIGRMALWSPNWPHHAAKALKATLKLPIQYERSNIFD